MSDLLGQIAQYLATKLEKTLGKQVFYYEMPDAPDECICVQETKSSLSAPPQVDATSRRIRISARAPTNIAANALAEQAYRWMHCSEDSLEDTTGFLELSEGVFVFSDLRSKPLWDKSDQRGRKYFTFESVITTSRF